MLGNLSLSYQLLLFFDNIVLLLFIKPLLFCSLFCVCQIYDESGQVQILPCVLHKAKMCTSHCTFPTKYFSLHTCHSTMVTDTAHPECTGGTRRLMTGTVGKVDKTSLNPPILTIPKKL